MTVMAAIASTRTNGIARLMGDLLPGRSEPSLPNQLSPRRGGDHNALVGRWRIRTLQQTGSARDGIAILTRSPSFARHVVLTCQIRGPRIGPLRTFVPKRASREPSTRVRDGGSMMCAALRGPT